MPRLPQKVFIDTGAFLAWELVRDQYHTVAAAGWEILAESAVPMITTDHVLDETLTLLGRRASYALAAARGVDYLESSALTVFQPSREDLLNATKGMRKYADQGVSFTDCLSFAVMKRERIKNVFGFDRHFEAAGFRLWRPLLSA